MRILSNHKMPIYLQDQKYILKIGLLNTYTTNSALFINDRNTAKE